MRPVTQQYAIQPSGALKPLSPPTAAFSPESLSVDLTKPESWVEIIMTAEFSIISSISARKSEDNLMSTCLYYITAN